MPGRIQQIRKSIDAKLDSLQAQADALDAHFASTKREAQRRIDSQKQALRDALSQLKREIQRQSGIAQEKKQQLATAIDELTVQAALARAETMDALEAQLKNLREAIVKFEKLAEGHLSGAQQRLSAGAGTIMRHYVQACDSLSAELQASRARLKQEASRRGIDLEESKREFDKKVAALKKQLAEQRKLHAQKWKQFQQELEPGLNQITKAFKELFSGRAKSPGETQHG